LNGSERVKWPTGKRKGMWGRTERKKLSNVSKPQWMVGTPFTSCLVSLQMKLGMVYPHLSDLEVS
jgi:hypothetical protein